MSRVIAFSQAFGDSLTMKKLRLLDMDRFLVVSDAQDLLERLNTSSWSMALIEVNSENLFAKDQLVDQIRKKFNIFDLPILIFSEQPLKNAKEFSQIYDISEFVVAPTAAALVDKCRESMKKNLSNEIVKKIILQSFSDDPTLQKEPGLAKAAAGDRCLYRVIYEKEYFVVAKSGSLSKRQIEEMPIKTLSKVASLYKMHSKVWRRFWPSRWTIELLIKESKGATENKLPLPQDVQEILDKAERYLDGA